MNGKEYKQLEKALRESGRDPKTMMKVYEATKSYPLLVDNFVAVYNEDTQRDEFQQ